MDLQRNKTALFRVKQGQSFAFKTTYAEMRAWEFVRECARRGLDVHVCVGGLDSITLLTWLRAIGINCPAVSVSMLEDASIQAVHARLGVEPVPPRRGMVAVLRDYGYPVIGKQEAAKIAALQRPTADNAELRRGILTGVGPDGRFSRRRQLAARWLRLFGGSDPDGARLGYAAAPFAVSDRCCEMQKEEPLRRWAAQRHSAPFLGLMASEGGRRERALIEHGCNYFGAGVVRSAPFAIFGRQDLLRLALDVGAPVPEIYGEIRRDADGTLYTTGADRTGCTMCGFGAHLEDRPNRFDLLRRRDGRAWRYWMYDRGWGDVLDYIGVGWR